MEKIATLDYSTVPKMASHENIVIIVQQMESKSIDYSISLKCLSTFFVHNDDSIV